MTIQVLVAAMHQTDHSLPEKMNIQSDCIVGNQCDRNEIEHFEWQGHQVTYLNFAERGVGLNRNNALMRATADVCMFSDDDVVFYNGYDKIIRETYEEHPEADVIIFNMRRIYDQGARIEDKVKKDGFVGKRGAASYGTAHVSIRTESIKKKNICFHRMFGGGTEYSNGEDTIFLQDCCKKGLKVYLCSKTLGEVYHNDSTWFTGYNDKYFFDRGVLFGYLYPLPARALAIYHVVRHRKKYREYGLKNAILMMWKGIKHGV